MGSIVFKGGVHPDYRKEITASLAITKMELPSKVVIPLQQHIGAPCEPLEGIEVGAEVKTGQRIAESSGFVSAPIHASISGKITEIGPYNHPLGRPVKAITIESDGRDQWVDDLKPVGDPSSLTPKEIRKIVQEAGIVGLGGATFPAHVKLSPPEEKPIDVVIINGAECEPYLTADHRVMLEKTEKIVFGLKMMIKALGAEKGIIGIEDNKADAIQAMEQAIAEEDNITINRLHTKYPQGAEKMLILVTTGRKVPSGGLPMEVGVVNHNVGTSVAICDAIREGKPLIERVVTITGEGINRPANMLIRVGTIVSNVLETCGGLKEETRKLILGGPMMGLAQPDADLPVIKGTSGILALTDDDVYLAESSPCIRCAKCVDACPVQLVPTAIAQAAEHGLFKKAEKLHALDCFECGCCAYVCPAKIPLTQLIRIAKAEIVKAKKK
ncbi:MAG: electron transporter RnfC [Firmicutes bacterium ML8_F2]|jgi:Na+-translocating ferredoxin:NAD+ oxidoreductase subunit C|nr:MAG: electron transporter RnfC [Firmicutes bacterium ML8_F2]